MIPFCSLAKLFSEIVIVPVLRPMQSNAEVWNERAINCETCLPQCHNHICNFFKHAKKTGGTELLCQRNPVMKLFPNAWNLVPRVISNLRIYKLL